MNISKTAADVQAFARPFRTFVNARTAFKVFLAGQNFRNDERVLLPSYVGWSPREGSGVFDPVRELELPCGFYRLDDRLHVDLEHLELQLRQDPVKVVVLIHYFGYVDPSYADAVALARRYGAQVLEDEAHAFLTDWVGGMSGRLGDACVASLHKLLPVPRGGLLIGSHSSRPYIEHLPPDTESAGIPFRYDLFSIARRRRENAAYLAERLPALRHYLEPLWGAPRPGEIPQTFPVLVRRASRDRLYTQLNQDGFGVVSLYHTLIREISSHEFPESHRMARRILNLPVHQDVTLSDLDALLDRLAAVLPALEEPARHATCQ